MFLNVFKWVFCSGGWCVVVGYCYLLKNFDVCFGNDMLFFLYLDCEEFLNVVVQCEFVGMWLDVDWFDFVFVFEIDLCFDQVVCEYFFFGEVFVVGFEMVDYI